MRFQKIENGNIIYIFSESAYNASPISMEKAILTFSDIYNDRYKVVVFRGYAGLGRGSQNFTRSWKNILRNTKQNEILLYGSLMKNIFMKKSKIWMFSFEVTNLLSGKSSEDIIPKRKHDSAEKDPERND